MQIKIATLSALLVVGLNASAGEAHTTYRISRTGAAVTTTVSNPSVAQSKVLESYIFDLMVENLKSFRGIESVQIAPGAKRIESVEKFEDSSEYTRRYPVQVKLTTPEKVTLTFQVEETYRKCNPGYACSPSAYLKVTSGSQQDVSIEVQSHGPELLSIVSNYNLNSVIIGLKANHERNTIMVAAARALRANNEKMVQ